LKGLNRERRGLWAISQDAVMSGRDLAQVRSCDPLDASIGGMCQERDMSQVQPTAQRFGINGEQTTTVGQRNEGHRATPFVLLVTRTTNGQGISRELSREICRELSSEISRECRRTEQTILLSRDACDDNSPPSIDALVETSTTDKSEVQKRGRAR